MMNNESFTATIGVAKSANDVFTAITHETAKWWGGNDFQGRAKKLNDEFVINHPGSHYSKQKVVEIIPGKKVVWLVTESTIPWLQKNKHEWANTKIIFQITTKQDKTILHFTHEGLVPQKECFAMCSLGWSKVIKEWLFCLVTDGKPHFILQGNHSII